MPMPSNRYSAFFFVFASALLIVSVAYLISWLLSIIVSAVAVIIFYLSAPIWRRRAESQSRTKIFAIFALASIPAPLFFPELLGSTIKALLQIFDIEIATKINFLYNQGSEPILLLFYVIFASATAFIATTPQSQDIIQPLKVTSPLDRDSTFIRKFSAFSSIWFSRLDALDRDLNWSDQDFVSLNADVEMTSRRTHRTIIVPLVDALRKIANSKGGEQPVIILGEPGSGKSVSLRRLARLLLSDAVKTRRMPIYINLKNWRTPSSWSEAAPPKTSDLWDFVKETVKSEANDIFAARFIDTYFEAMLSEGRFFFIFDSFDEIPLVIDNPEDSWAINAVSKCLHDFLLGTHSSQGIVASRYFKKPTAALGSGTTLRIRPFDEVRIRKILKRIGGLSNDEVVNAFRTRASIVSSASNPMVANLMASYLREGNGSWPNNTYEIFRDYISRRITDPQTNQKLLALRLTSDEVYSASSKIAEYMIQDASHALTVPLSQLQALNLGCDVSAVVDVLRFTRLGRTTTSGDPGFSFSHRRFQEFFIVSNLSKAQVDSAIESIKVDNRFRDILALYCETASTENAVEVANHSLKLLDEVDSEQSRSSQEKIQGRVQILRFITDAFKTREDLPIEFMRGLRKSVEHLLYHHGKDRFQPLLAKFAAETLSVLAGTDASRVTQLALGYPNKYVRETAFRASRHRVPVPSALASFVDSEMLDRRYRPLTGSRLLTIFSELRFSLKLSSGLRREVAVLYGWLIDVFLLPISIALIFLLSPLFAIAYCVAFYLLTRARLPAEFLWATRFLACIFAGMILASIVFSFSAAHYLFASDGREFVMYFQRIDSPLPSIILPTPFLVAFQDPDPFLAIAGLFILLNLGLPIGPVFFGKVWDASNRAGSVKELPADKSGASSLSIRESLSSAREGISESARIIEDKWRTRERRTLSLGEKVVYGFLLLFCAIFALLSLAFGLETVAIFAAFIALVVFSAGTFFVGLRFGIPFLVGYLSKRRKDAQTLKSVTVLSPMRRDLIGKTLNALYLERSRLRFLSLLSVKHVSVVGEWEDFGSLIAENDLVTDRLIRLEERWLRLDE